MMPQGCISSWTVHGPDRLERNDNKCMITAMNLKVLVCVVHVTEREPTCRHCTMAVPVSLSGIAAA